MIEQTALTAAELATGRVLRVGVGFSSHPDTIWAAVRATAMARTGLHGATPDLVLLVTAGVPTQDAVPMIRGALGAVGVAGGSTTAILTHNGAVGAGALVVCLANRRARGSPVSSSRAGRSGCAIRAASGSPSSGPASARRPSSSWRRGAC